MARIIRESGSMDIKRFNKFVTSSLISAIIFFIVGLIIFIFSKQVGILIGYIIGIIFIYTGIMAIYKYLKRDGARLYSLNLIFGIIACVLGVVIMFAPTSVTSFVNVCFGLYLAVMGANKISYGVWFKVGNDPAWLITIVIGIMIIVFGILVILNPFETMITGTKLVGLFLMISSILDITDTILLKKRCEEIVKIFW